MNATKCIFESLPKNYVVKNLTQAVTIFTIVNVIIVSFDSKCVTLLNFYTIIVDLYTSEMYAVEIFFCLSGNILVKLFPLFTFIQPERTIMFANRANKKQETQERLEAVQISF